LTASQEWFHKSRKVKKEKGCMMRAVAASAALCCPDAFIFFL
jgi:hypothetical protein